MNIVQYYEGTPISPVPNQYYARCMASVVAYCKAHNIVYSLVKSLPSGVVDPLGAAGTPASRSYAFRIAHLAANPDDIYIDCDVEITKPIIGVTPAIMKTDKPYVAVNQRGLPAICIMIGNGLPTLFEELQAAKVEAGQRPAMVWCDHLAANPDKWYAIPEGYFNHLHLHSPAMVNVNKAMKK
jgi:hypothetical protein